MAVKWVTSFTIRSSLRWVPGVVLVVGGSSIADKSIGTPDDVWSVAVTGTTLTGTGDVIMAFMADGSHHAGG